MSIRTLVDEIADVDWRSPAWLAFRAAAELLDRIRVAPRYAEYLAANSGPDSDTFMARPVAAQAFGDLDRAHARGKAALEAIRTLDGTLPGQPLRIRIGPRGESVPVANPTYAIIGVDEPPNAIVAVALDEQPLDRIRHIHRRAWRKRGGPWLGVGEARGLEVVSTSHLAIDGYGHALLADKILSAPTGAPLPPASAILDADPPFMRSAFAFGRALAAIAPRPGRFSPTFQVPVAPGSAPDRRRTRVLVTLLSVENSESFESFQARARRIVAREPDGFLSRLLGGISALPAPLRLMLLASGENRSDVADVLRGRGQISSMRFAPDERPRAPLLAGSGAPGGPVLTLIHHGDGRVTATAVGPGSPRLLDAWRARLS